ncbi:MAG: hypothetical protein GKS06_11320 [Acidobacteria bacterium]|nr:hypothetical protein [Acidobacteriota bacterium]
MATDPYPDELEAPPSFPWQRAAVLLLAAWASIWVAGVVGGRAGEYVFDDRYLPEPPYTNQELASLERVSPDTYNLAMMDMGAWETTVDMGRTLARLEGRVIGSLVLLGAWASLGMVWMWNRQRAKRTSLHLSTDFS